MLTLPNKNYRGVSKFIFVACLLISLLLTACGYRGPLYLPDETPGQPTSETSKSDIQGNLPADDENSEDVLMKEGNEDPANEQDEEEDRDGDGNPNV